MLGYEYLSLLVGEGNAQGHVGGFLCMILLYVRGLITTFKEDQSWNDLTSEQKLHLKTKEPTQSLPWIQSLTQEMRLPRGSWDGPGHKECLQSLKSGGKQLLAGGRDHWRTNPGEGLHLQNFSLVFLLLVFNLLEFFV